MDCGLGGVVVASPDLHYWSKTINAHLWNARFHRWAFQFGLYLVVAGRSCTGSL